MRDSAYTRDIEFATFYHVRVVYACSVSTCCWLGLEVLVGDLARRSSPNHQNPARYQHPGYAFLRRYGSLQTEEDIFEYVDFLREVGQLGDRLPIDLEKIYRAFGIPIPLRVPLEDQQGILLNSTTGIILIREGDPIVRQRFTEGHELIELLFDAQADVADELNLRQWDEAYKERLCDAGAAELLMPKTLFRSHIQHLGTSIETARSLSRIYKTSLIATLIRMVKLTQGEFAISLWKPMGLGWQLEWSVVSDAWCEGFLAAGLRVDWQLLPRLTPRSKIPQFLELAVPLRSGLKSVRSELLRIGQDDQLSLLLLFRI